VILGNLAKQGLVGPRWNRVSLRGIAGALALVVCVGWFGVSVGSCAENIPVCKADATSTTMRARKLLVKLTGHETALIRLHAVEALGESGEISAIEQIHRCFGDEYAGVRFAACMAVMKLRDQSAKPLLRKLLDDPDLSVQAAAAAAMDVLGDKRYRRVMAKALKSDDATVRRNACLVIGRMGDRDADVVVKQAALTDKDLSVRLQATEAMALLGNTRALKLMMNYCRSAYDDERILALLTLGQAEAHEVLDEIVYVYEHSQSRGQLGMRLVAGRALGMLGDDRGFAEAVDALDYNEDLDSASAQIRMLAAMALGDIGKPAALCVLQEALKDQDQDVGIAAACAILKIGRRSFEN